MRNAFVNLSFIFKLGVWTEYIRKSQPYAENQDKTNFSSSMRFSADHIDLPLCTV